MSDKVSIDISPELYVKLRDHGIARWAGANVAMEEVIANLFFAMPDQRVEFLEAQNIMLREAHHDLVVAKDMKHELFKTYNLAYFDLLQSCKDFLSGDLPPEEFVKKVMKDD